MELDHIAVNQQAKTDGVWVELIDDARIRVRNSSYPPYQKAFEALIVVYKAKQVNGELSDKDSDAFRLEIRDLLANHIIVDWEGIKQAGKPLEYSPATAKQIMKDMRYEKFHTAVNDAAQNLDLCLEEVVKEAEKKS